MNKLKLMTIVGTRPELIRLSETIKKADRHFEHVFAHTGQNYDANLNDVFYEDLDLRRPDHYLGVAGDHLGQTIGNIIAKSYELMREVKPDALLLLGDTNSALSVISAKRLKIPVFHMEAGNRCFDDRTPEEVNRRAIDHASDVLMPYTNRSRDNLLREGIPPNRVYVTGNPIKEVLDFYAPEIEASAALKTLGAEDGRYFLATLHRAENVDVPARLDSFMAAFGAVARDSGLPVLLSLHPRTRARLAEGGLSAPPGVTFLDPPGFFDFVRLERGARALLSDSGTVQEEGCILNVPAVTLRDATERPETLECGSNVLSGCSEIPRCLALILSRPPVWTPPAEYLEPAASRIVAGIVLGYRNA